MNKIQINFLVKALLGRETNLCNPDEVIRKCIRIAHRDMMTVGRFYLGEGTDKRVDELYNLLKNNKYVFSRDLIDDALPIFGTNDIIKNSRGYHATRYGLAQKFVNMTFKYLYIFRDYTGLSIDFSKCDCPLDSIIIDKLIKNKKAVWSKLDKAQYIACQDEIADLLSKMKLCKCYNDLGNLAFDFIHW